MGKIIKIAYKVIKLTKEEQIVLLYFLLTDIRKGNPNSSSKYSRRHDKRVLLALDLIDSLKLKHNLLLHFQSQTDNLGLYLTGLYECKIIPDDFNEGGAEGMLDIFNIKLKRFDEYSQRFQSLAKLYLYNWDSMGYFLNKNF